MDITGATVLITGANRGIGRELVTEVLSRGAERVYAATRGPVDWEDPRVVPLLLDITDPAQIDGAVARVGSLDILINNAGIAEWDDLTDRASLERHLTVNLLGTFDVIRGFLPALQRSQGAIVNLNSVSALAALPMLPAYSVSKAAAFAMSQAFRALLAPTGVSVHAVLAGPVDTEMSRDLHIPKAAPALVAAGILDGLAHDHDEIFPDVVSAMLAPGWDGGAVKALEREFGGGVDASAA